MDTSKTGGGNPTPTEQPEYETTKGCLTFLIIGVVLAAIIAGVIVLFGTPT